METDALDVSVVLCAYTQDRWEDLIQALHSVQNQTLPPGEIILVIDHNPALHRRAQKVFKDVEIIENKEAPGLSGARNSGIAQATGDIIAFMDEDAVAASDWIEKLLSGYQDPWVIGVGGKIYPLWAVSQPDWFPEEFNWVVGCSYKGLPSTPAPVRNLIGCNMSYRKEVFVDVGGFRNGIGRLGTIPVGCEETELCIRARQHRSKNILLYMPSARVYHQVPEWRVRARYFFHRCYAEGLSKAQVTGFVGAGDGLESEQQYVLKTLTKAVFSGVAEACLHGRPAGIKRAAAILAGLSTTTVGYLMGLAIGLNMSRFPRQRHPSPYVVNKNLD